MNTEQLSALGYSIETGTAKMDIPVIHNYLANESYWAKNVPLHIVEKYVQHSFNFGVFYRNEQVGYARVITDYTTIAYLGDVFILQEHRGKGLSKWLMQTIMDHPELQGLRRWILATADAHGLYKQFGWTPLKIPDRWMEFHNPDVYTKKNND